MKAKSITRDTIILTAVSLILQGLSLLLNIFITRALGTVMVGVTSLIFSFYAFVIVLSNGNIFTSTSRFVSEEIGKRGNIEKIVGYALKFGLLLSGGFMLAIFILAKRIGMGALHSETSVVAIRIMALSLPLGAVASCLKGYFHACRKIRCPCISDVLEFIFKAVVIISMTPFVTAGKLDVFSAISISIVAGEIASCGYLCIIYALTKNPASAVGPASINGIFRYIAAIFPIALSGYIYVLLSGANEALVPITLKMFSGSSDIALSQYGIFEAIIIPILFFPTGILQSLSVILVPEIAREKAAGRIMRVRFLARKALGRGLLWAGLIGGILFFFGEKIGAIACDDALAGSALHTLSFVVPFIYLEILMEGVLKGLGEQNFSTAVGAVEYILRVACVVIFVPMLGFDGVLVSYFVSNISCNLLRFFKLIRCKIILTKFSKNTSISSENVVY